MTMPQKETSQQISSMQDRMITQMSLMTIKRTAECCQPLYLKLSNVDGTAKLPGSLSKRKLSKGSKDLFAPALARMPTRFCLNRLVHQLLLVVHKDCSTKSLDLFRLATSMTSDGCRVHPISKKLRPCDANLHESPVHAVATPCTDPTPSVV